MQFYCICMIDMDTRNQIKILLLEDDEDVCKEFKNYIDTRNDIRLVSITNSTIQALKDIVTYIPNVIIIDIQLDKGDGSGIMFLEKLKELKLDYIPLRIVITNMDSEIIDNYVHMGNADMIFHKKVENYSIELIIENIVVLEKAIYNTNNKSKNNSNIETIEERNKRIQNKINTELDLIGIGQHLIGRKYIFDALFYLLPEEHSSESVFSFLAEKYKKCNSAIYRSIQTAIYRAWRTMPLEEIELYFTAKYDYQKGVPTPTEFLFYYKDKIKKQLI